jgi:hypothetical protein
VNAVERGTRFAGVTGARAFAAPSLHGHVDSAMHRTAERLARLHHLLKGAGARWNGIFRPERAVCKPIAGRPLPDEARTLLRIGTSETRVSFDSKGGDSMSRARSKCNEQGARATARPRGDRHFAELARNCRFASALCGARAGYRED